MKFLSQKNFWSIKLFFIATLGAFIFSIIALMRGENISALWILFAFLCSAIIGYRFYSAFIAAKILHLDGKNQTPAYKINDGKDFVPTNKWIVFGHHFAAIAGPGPLIGPTLAAQFGFLPSTLWILIGCVLAGCVQDMVILFASVKRNGKSLGQMIKDEIGPISGYAALIGTLAIIIILIAVLGLVVVKALMHSPWGSFTVLMTIPIAMIIGIYLRIKPQAVLSASLTGISLFLVAVFLGKFIHQSPYLSNIFDVSGKFLAFSVISYGFFAACLPVWLLLAPRDYLSSFLKLGTIFLLAIALIIFNPTLQMPAVTQFIDGSGPIFSGKIFPFLFITIACGAISGFHALVSSGTTPKIISNERDVRFIGYGSMLLEGLVAIMAIIAASVMDPAIFFAINSPASVLGDNPSAVISSFGFELNAQKMQALAAQMGENTLFSRTGGAPSLAVAMANIFASAFGSSLLSLWYHFAIMFEAIFILTTLDAGTRVARFMLEDLIRQISKNKISCKSKLMPVISSFLIVISWGYFLYIGVIDPNGGINILWPLFGMSNQMLAGIALCLGMVILAKKKKIYALICGLPLCFVAFTTSFAVLEKVFSSNIKLGFLAAAKNLKEKINSNSLDENSLEIAEKLVFNQYLLSFLALTFLIILWIVIIDSVKRVIGKPSPSSA